VLETARCTDCSQFGYPTGEISLSLSFVYVFTFFFLFCIVYFCFFFLPNGEILREEETAIGPYPEPRKRKDKLGTHSVTILALSAEFDF
jgi:hypothetical protein